jgi:hypothetical protein
MMVLVVVEKSDFKEAEIIKILLTRWPRLSDQYPFWSLTIKQSTSLQQGSPSARVMVHKIF